MKIVVVTPAPPGSRHGNRHTATRWARMLQASGHRCQIQTTWDGSDVDAMLALHARRSADSIARFAEAHPGRPLIVTLTGTDLYRDIDDDAAAQRSLDLAHRLIVLQSMGPAALPVVHRQKACIVYQSAPSIRRVPPLSKCFEICVSGHLRTEKDPFRTAAALAFLPNDSRIRVSHVGGAMSADMAKEAAQWMRREPRYRWLGEVPRWRATRLLARSRAMVISSRLEGGATVVSEAIEAGVPVIASAIPGNVGMLGPDHPAYFPVGDERALAALLAKAEREPEYLARLAACSVARRPLISSAAEQDALAKLFVDD